MSSSKHSLSTCTSSAQPLLVTGALALLVTFGAGCDSDSKTAQEQPTQPTTSTSTATYKDGTYVATGDYTVPAGPEQVEVTLTLKDGIITNTNFKGTPNAPKSRQFMGIFEQNYKPLVVGKKLSELKLEKVSGSSLTPKGFNDAVEKIKQQASG